MDPRFEPGPFNPEGELNVEMCRANQQAYTWVDIDRAIVAANREALAKGGETQPPIRIQSKGFTETRHAYEIDITGPSIMVYSPSDRLECGANVALATKAEIRVLR